MKSEMLPLEDIRVRGFSALVKELGPVNAVRFISQYELGEGDYTRDRRRVIGNQSAAEVLEAIKARRRGRAKANG